MKEILNEIIARVEIYRDDELYKHYDDYYKAGVYEGIDKVIDIIEEYLNDCEEN